MQYAAWTREASRFLRSLTRLPGRISIDDGIEPPATDSAMQEWLTSGRCSLPREVHKFIATASRRCYFRYCWRPEANAQPRLRALLPNTNELTGGGNLCEAYGFCNYDHRDWFKNVYPSLMDDAASWLADVLPAEIAEALPVSMGSALLQHSDLGGDERAAGRIEIMPLSDGATIALEIDSQQRAGAVVHLNADRKERHIISSSFDEFLVNWAKICYLTPTMENLIPWLDPASGRLSPVEEKAIQLRDLFSAASDAGED